jgi:TonB family protein
MKYYDQDKTRIYKFEEDKKNFRILFEKSLIISLIIFIALFTIFRRIPRGKFRQQYITINGVSVFDIPITIQGGIPRSPTIPPVPLPVDDDYIPDDETIPDTDLELYEDILQLDKYGEGRGPIAIRPRPIKDVIPEYPQKERKMGIKGEVVVKLLVNSSGSVDSVIVVSNTTNYSSFVRAAKRAAYKTKYLPAQYKKENFARWIERKYTWK